MVKKTRDDAVFVTGIGMDTTFENLRDLFSSVGNIKVLWVSMSKYLVCFVGGQKYWPFYDQNV